MSLDAILSISGMAYLAVVLWLAMRVINRRDRWAVWTVAAVIGVPFAYVVSFGPACWIASRTKSETLPRCYLPVLYAGMLSDSVTVLELAGWYAGLGMARTGAVNFPLVDADDATGYCIYNSAAETGEFSIYRVQGRWSIYGLLSKNSRVVPASAVSPSR
jgi:hypothetical protein